MQPQSPERTETTTIENSLPTQNNVAKGIGLIVSKAKEIYQLLLPHIVCDTQENLGDDTPFYTKWHEERLKKLS